MDSWGQRVFLKGRQSYSRWWSYVVRAGGRGGGRRYKMGFFVRGGLVSLLNC